MSVVQSLYHLQYSRFALYAFRNGYFVRGLLRFIKSIHCIPYALRNNIPEITSRCYNAFVM